MKEAKLWLEKWEVQVFLGDINLAPIMPCSFLNSDTYHIVVSYYLLLSYETLEN